MEKKIFSFDKIILALAVLFFLAAIAFALHVKGSNSWQYFLRYNSGSVNYKVVLTAKGFSPNIVSIYQGDTVTFTTNANQPFWPASDPHPTHTDYPGFDSGKPIKSNGSWTFRFDNAGEWGYHDHFLPSFRGTVRVMFHNGKLPEAAPVSLESCHTAVNKQQCWSKLMDKTVDKEGLKGGFSLLTNLYSTEPDFISYCHDYTHRLGEKAYTLFSQNQDVPLSPETSNCGYGFYHGFMEKLLLDSGNLDNAGKFCNYVSTKMGQALTNACEHGVGHGAQALAVTDSGTWGHPQAMLDKALAVCHKVFSDQNIFPLCASGVFMELANNYNSGEYDINLNPEDPYKICENQESSAKVACYSQFYGVILKLSNTDFTTAVSFVEKIKDDYFAQQAMETLPNAFMDMSSKNQNAALKVCRSVQQRLHSSCISGMSLTFMLRSTPGSEYKNAINFCENSKLSAAEKAPCFNIVTSQSKAMYSPNVFEQVCNSLEPIYKNNGCIN